MSTIAQNFPNVHLTNIFLDYIDNESLDDPTDFLESVRTAEPRIIDPDPFSRRSKNTTDRQTLATQPTPSSAGLPADLKLTQQSFDRIIALSDELDMNELDAATKWHNASKKELVLQMVQLTGRDVGDLETKPEETVKFMFFVERIKLITAVTSLFKARYYGGSLVPEKCMKIMHVTNDLLTKGIAMKYMDRLAKGLIELKNASLHRSFQEFVISTLQSMSEAIFFMFYQTQITSSESVALTQLLLELSNCQTDEAYVEWLPGIFRVLIVLQLTQVRALNQVQELFSRDVSTPPYSTGAVGNTLPTPVGSKDFMDRNWHCAMVKGFSCLGLAILRQPAVEASELPSEDVLWFLRQSSLCRAFTYVRCCLLPVLQAMHTDPNQQLYLSVLTDLIYNSLTLFTQSNYHTTGFPYPVSEGSYQEDELWQPAGELVNDDGSPVSPRIPRDTQEDVADCITALCNAYPPFAVRFWSISSNDGADTSYNSSMTSRSGDLSTMHHHPFVGRALDGVLQDGSLIVPVFRMLAAIAHGAAAIVPSLSARVAVGAETNIGILPHSGQACALATYNLLRRKHVDRLDWGYIFRIIEAYTQRLTVTVPRSVQTSLPVLGQNAAPIVTPQLIPKDVDALSAMVELIGSVCNEPSVVQSFVSHGYSPIKRLFGLLASPVPGRLKGKIYLALSVLCKSSTEIAHEIWDSLESYDILSIMPNKELGRQFYGLRYELEAIESLEGVYPSTEGFLCLFEALLTHHKVPEAIGFGYRLPGICGYLDFVIDEVLLKASQRSYLIVNSAGMLDISGSVSFSSKEEKSSETGSGQRWSIVTHCIKILAAVLQQYPINEISNSDLRMGPFTRMHQSGHFSSSWTPEEVAEYAADFSETVRRYNIASENNTVGAAGNAISQQIMQWPRPKSSGFVVMSRILDSYGAILNCLMSILRENSSAVLDKILLNQVEARSLDALRALALTDAESRREDPQHRVASGHHSGRFPASHSWHSGLHTTIANTVGANHVLNYGLLSMPIACSDVLFWREKCINSVIGLIYECMLRERIFLECISAAPPLTILRTVNGRPTVQELHLTNVFMSLASYQTRSPHAIMAHFIRYAPVASRHVVVMPSVPVMAVRILELALPQGSAAEHRLLQSKDVFAESYDHNSAAQSAASFGLGFTRACALALRDPTDAYTASEFDPIALRIAAHGVAPPSDVLPLGAGNVGCRHDMFTLTISDDTYYSSSANVDADALSKSCDQIRAAIHSIHYHSDETGALVGYCSPQGAVLDYLLRGLHSARYCVVHKLLGFVESSSSDGRVSLQLSHRAMESSGSRISGDDNALFAALDVLDTMPARLRLLSDDGDNAFIGGNFIRFSVQSYDIANKCMELLYHLCASPLTSVATLAALRHRRVKTDSSRLSLSFDTQRMHSFYISQLRLCLYWASSSACINLNETMSILLQACRLNYVSWFLKILALELHVVEVQQDSSVSAKQMLKLILTLFSSENLSHERDMLHLNGHPARHVGITSLLFLLQKYTGLPRALEYPEVKGLFDKVSRQYYVGVVASHMALCGRSDPTEKSAFSIISLRRVKAALQTDANGESDNILDSSSVESNSNKKVFEVLDMAAMYNRYTVQMASTSHFCQAWRQVIDVSFLGWGKILMPSSLRENGADLLDSSLSPGVLIDSVMLPLLSLLASRSDMEMVSAEPLSRAFLSMTAFFREICAMKINSVVEHSLEVNRNDRSSAWKNGQEIFGSATDTLISESQHEALLTGIIHSILRRGSPGEVRINGSILYRSFLYSALVHTLRMMTVANTSEFDPNDSSRSELDTIAFEYRLRSMVILEPFTSILSEILIRDAVSPHSPVCWKLNSIASLGTLLSVFLASPFVGDAEYDFDLDLNGRNSKRQKQQYASHTTGYHQIVSQLANKGHLEDLFRHGLDESTNQGTLDIGMYRVILDMCVPIACNEEGVNLLCKNKLLEYIIKLRPIEPTPALLDDSIGFSSRASIDRLRMEAEEMIDDLLAPILRVFRAMLSCSPSCVVGCASFLYRNADVVRYVLNMKIKSLVGLELIRSLVNVMSMVSAHMPTHGEHASRAKDDGEGRYWDASFGAMGDFFGAEITALLKKIGNMPLPGLQSGTAYSSKKQPSWWTSIQPSNEHEWSLAARVCAAPLSANAAIAAVRETTGQSDISSEFGLGLNRTWSYYDSMKLHLGHKILEGIASILRSRSSVLGPFSGTIAHREIIDSVDIGVIAEAFCRCADLYITKSYIDENQAFDSASWHSLEMQNPKMSAKYPNQNNWLTSSSPIQFSKSTVTPSGFGISNVARIALRAIGQSESNDKDSDVPRDTDNIKVRTAPLAPGVADVDTTLSFVSENLICAIYSVAMSLSASEFAEKSLPIEACLKICEKYPAHSLISEVGRWLRKLSF